MFLVEFSEPELREIAIDLTVTAARFSRYQRQMSRNETTAATWRALSLLEASGPLRVTEFAHLDRLSQPAATSTLRRVIAEGYAEAVADSADRRAKKVRLTEDGRTFLGELRHDASDRLLAEFTQLSDAEIESIRLASAALTRVMHNDTRTDVRGQPADGTPSGAETPPS